MPRYTSDVVQWKNRQGHRISNGAVELTVLTGGGHIVNFRLCGSPMNALWEAPWQTIEPKTFSSREHAALYGDGPVGRMLCGYSGHALALGYFGMPSAAEAEKGLPLHGEAANAEWTVVSNACDDDSASLVLEVELPAFGLHCQRTILLRAEACSASITEVVKNHRDSDLEFQWVQHAAFGEPLFKHDEATLFISARRGVTWPHGYEGHELLPDNTDYQWPHVQTTDSQQVDLSQPFIREGTGFLASLLTDPNREDAFVVVHNRRHALVAGYLFDRKQFPWIALWEENRAREYAPWNSRTRARGVEFGTSPMPLGLNQVRKMRTLFDTSTLASIARNSSIRTEYQLFMSPVPRDWTRIEDVRQTSNNLIVCGDNGQEMNLGRS